jgi:predicted HTH domain antitoxin
MGVMTNDEIEQAVMQAGYVSGGKKPEKRGNRMSAVVTLEMPQDVLDSARLTAAELKTELAVYLYAQRRLSIGKARELADRPLWEFRQLLASRRISPHYDESDLEEDVATLRKMGRL